MAKALYLMAKLISSLLVLLTVRAPLRKLNRILSRFLHKYQPLKNDHRAGKRSKKLTFSAKNGAKRWKGLKKKEVSVRNAMEQ